jgi:putative addiction module component (TIGR02574 family)
MPRPRRSLELRLETNSSAKHVHDNPTLDQRVRFLAPSLVDSDQSLGASVMSTSAKTVMDQALKLPANDRAALVETLILSLDKPDPALDAEWLREAEDRLSAYQSGELAAVDADEVFRELGDRT